MNIAVLGSGNGGCAVSFDCAAHGHRVSLFDFDKFPHNIQRIREQGGIRSSGEINGFAPVFYAGHDVETAMKDADIIFAVGPAYSTKPFAAACKPYLHKEQMVIVCPGSCGGSIEFKNGAGLAIRDRDIIVAETSTLPYAVRLIEPGVINVFLKLIDGVFLAAVPASLTSLVFEKVRDIYPAIRIAENVLQTSLQNGNPVIHPAVSLLNTTLIERTGGDFYFYEDGVTPAVGRLIKEIDQERIAIGTRLGVEVISEPELGCQQGYMKEPTYDSGYSRAPGFKGIKAQSSLNYRYFHEDVGYGLVFLQSLGAQIEVDTPTISAVIKLVSVLMERDYLSETKRTMASLGLSGYTGDELKQLLA